MNNHINNNMMFGKYYIIIEYYLLIHTLFIEMRLPITSANAREERHLAESEVEKPRERAYSGVYI